MNATKIEEAQSQTEQPRHAGGTKIEEAQSQNQISSEFDNVDPNKA